MQHLNHLKPYFESADFDKDVLNPGPEIYDVYTPKASLDDFSISFEYYTDSKPYGLDIYPGRKCFHLFVDSKDYWLDNNVSFHKAFIYRFESSEQASRDLFNFIQFTVSSVQWCYDSWIDKEE